MMSGPPIRVMGMLPSQELRPHCADDAVPPVSVMGILPSQELRPASDTSRVEDSRQSWAQKKMVFARSTAFVCFFPSPNYPSKWRFLDSQLNLSTM
ncbi:hypothetical protein M404DRAFT_737715 [Pisolithus tinctorius Marx 270]|uniref:Uncharacterized protein n=1 Tax=Pisolithus tinctorius Marx 270 TaxID=870435 RepID=A0A0C3J4X4_PISTI|nr:hypothetical protein M404DRAFT_737715 [Pisolithus tinctorius Marx 270]